MTHLFLMFNMGASGGSWFESVCNTHPDIRVWEELGRFLGVGFGPMTSEQHRERDVHILAFVKQQIKEGKWKSIGLIKSFSKPVILYGREVGARFVSMFRHPITVLEMKMGKKTHACERILGYKPKGEKDIFLGHVLLYRPRYLKYMSDVKGKGWRLIKLEDLDASLKTPDAVSFRETMEYVTRVSWSVADAEKVRKKAKPRHAKRKDWWNDDPTHEVWHGWPTWKKDIFKEFFTEILERAGYTLP